MTKISEEELEDLERELDENPEFRRKVRKLLREAGISGFDEEEQIKQTHTRGSLRCLPLHIRKESQKT